MESLNDRYYIAKLERLLEERKDLINELITICEDLVKEKDKLVGYAECCHKDNVNIHQAFSDEMERFDDLFEDYHVLDQEYCSALSQIDNLKLENKNLHNKVKDLKRTVKELKAENEYLKTEFKHYDAIIDGGIIV